MAVARVGNRGEGPIQARAGLKPAPASTATGLIPQRSTRHPTVGAGFRNCLGIAANVKIVARFFFCTLTLALSRRERGLATARNDRALSLWERVG